MRYLVTLEGWEPFMTDWFDPENNYLPGMVVYDLIDMVYTADGHNWKRITKDHL